MDNESTGGAISFEMLVETGQLDRASDETIKRIKGISRESVAAGKAVDDFFGATTDNIKIQKDVIGSLEKKYSDLQKEIDKLAPGKAQAQLRKEAAGIKAELEAEKSALTQLEGAVKQNEKAHESFRTQLRRVREELIAMEMAGKRGTAEYKVLQDEAGRLTDAMSDAQAQASVLAHDQRGLQGVIAAVSGIAGGFSAAQGAIGLFVGENENLQKIMLKVQSLMAITIGLQQIQQTLDKDSAFMLVTVAKAKELYASATNRLTVALGLSNVAAKALMATLTLGLSAAIGAAIYFIDRYISKQKEAAKKQEEFSKAISEEAYKAVSSIETLSAKYKSLGDNLKAKEKFIKDNANAFDDLGVSVRNVEEAENILINNKESFIRAQIEKAKSIAATQIAAEKWKEWLTNEEKLSKTKKYVTKNTTTYTGPGQSAVETSKTTISDEYYDISSKQIKIRAEINKLMELSVEADSAAGKIISGLGVNSEKALEGSIIAIENALSELNQKYKEAISDPERKALAEQIKTQEAKLQSLQPEKKTDSKDPFSEQLEKRKKLYQDYFNWINSNRTDLAESAKKEFENLLKGGNSFIESLEKQAKELEGKKGITDEQKKQLKTIRDYISTEVKTTTLDTFEKELTAKLEAAKTTLEKMSILDQAKPTGTTDLDKAKQIFIDSEKEKTIREEKELTKELLANYAGYLQEKIQFNETYAEKKRLLNLAAEKAENEDAKKIAKEAIDELERQRDQYNKRSGNQDYDDLITKYKSFKQQLNDLIVDFDKKVKVALENGNKELADTILKAKEEDVKKLISGFTQDEVSQYLESLKKSLSINLAIFSVTGEQADELLKIKSIIDLINNSLKEGRREDTVKALDYAIGSLNEISGLMGELDEIKAGDAYKKIAEELDKIGRVEAQRYLSLLEQQLEKLDKQTDAYKTIHGLIEQTKDVLKSGVVEDLNKASNELRSMADFASLFDEELGSIINNVSQIAGGLAAIASRNYFSGIMQIMTGVFTTIINASENAARKAEEYRERVLERLSERLSDINTLLERQIALIDNLSGTDKIKAYTDSFEDLRREIVSVLNQINELEVSRKGYRGVTNLDLDSLIKTYQELYGNGRDVLINELDRDIIERLISENEQAINQLYEKILNGNIAGDRAEELKLLIEQLEANRESFEDLKEQYNEYITDTTSDAIMESIISGFEEGKFAAEDFADTFEELMKNAMLQAVKMKYLEGPLKEWYETFASYSENGLTPEEIAALREAYNTIITSAATEAQNIQNITGTVAGMEDTLTGQVKGVTEETAGLIAGQMNAIRINQAHALALMDEQLANLSEIASNTRYNRLLVDIKNLLQSSKSNSVNENRANGGL